MAGWIKWYRQAELNSVLVKDEPYDRTHAFMWLVMKANTKNITSNKKTLKRGQLWTSIRIMARAWGWGRNKVAAFLDELEANGMIQCERATNGTVITVENYAKYQHQRATNRATNEATNRATNEAHNKNTEEEAAQLAPKNGAVGGKQKKPYVRPPVEKW